MDEEKEDRRKAKEAGGALAATLAYAMGTKTTTNTPIKKGTTNAAI